MPNKRFSELQSLMPPASQSRARAKTKLLQSDAPQDENPLDAMIDQMNNTTAQTSHAIDGAFALVEASNQQIAGKEPTVIQMG